MTDLSATPEIPDKEPTEIPKWIQSLTGEEVEHILNSWRPKALCQMCRDILEKLELPSRTSESVPREELTK